MKAEKAFVCYCRCGKHAYAAALDDGSDDPDVGLMLLDAVRRGRKVEHVAIGEVSLRLCDCIATPQQSAASNGD